jgi:hypothetical protein
MRYVPSSELIVQGDGCCIGFSGVLNCEVSRDEDGVVTLRLQIFNNKLRVETFTEKERQVLRLSVSPTMGSPAAVKQSPPRSISIPDYYSDENAALIRRFVEATDPRYVLAAIRETLGVEP